MKDTCMKAVKNILKKYKKGAVIESLEDDRVLDRYAATGMIHYGFNYETRKAEAALTKQGKWFLKQL